MTESSDAEYFRLASQVAEIEQLVRSGVRSDAGYLLTPFLENARARLDTIRFEDSKIEQEKKEHKEQEVASVAVLVEREKNLNAEEKEQYSEFLAKEYFQKSDFNKLDNFYAHTWPKLSEEGKSEMSHRVWEGIRHNEYKFDELPESIRRGESERLYQQFTVKATDEGLGNIPGKDKDDFILAHDKGNQEAVKSVLSREVFTGNVSSQSESSKLEDSRTKVNKSNSPAVRGVEAETNPLAKLSAVQETDEVSVPQVRTSVGSAPNLGKGG